MLSSCGAVPARGFALATAAAMICSRESSPEVEAALACASAAITAVGLAPFEIPRVAEGILMMYAAFTNEERRRSCLAALSWSRRAADIVTSTKLTSTFAISAMPFANPSLFNGSAAQTSGSETCRLMLPLMAVIVGAMPNDVVAAAVKIC